MKITKCTWGSYYSYSYLYSYIIPNYKSNIKDLVSNCQTFGKEEVYVTYYVPKDSHAHAQ